MTRIRTGAFFLIAFMAIVALYSWEQRKETAMASTIEPSKTPDAMTSILEFRKESETRLKSADGWLTVVGLTWLKPGENEIGSDIKNRVVLPKSAPKNLGTIVFEKDAAKLKVADATGVSLDDQPAKSGVSYELKNDDNGDAVKPTKVRIGGGDHTITWFLIKRKNGVGVRMKDTDSEARKKFVNKIWFEPNLQYRIEADWVAFLEPKKLMIPDILGNVNEEKSPGYAKFTLNGVKLELHPTEEDGELFYVFRDKTAGHETYGAARFLHSPYPKDGKVILDFNKAVNPPCAFTHYATCPMPVKENILAVEIRAGELKQPGEAHP